MRYNNGVKGCNKGPDCRSMHKCIFCGADQEKSVQRCPACKSATEPPVMTLRSLDAERRKYKANFGDVDPLDPTAPGQERDQYLYDTLM
eukprot:4124799-Amphidinium_carterae.1